MRALLAVLLCIVVLVPGRAAEVLSPPAFAEHVARAIRAALPSVVVTVRDSEVLVKDPIGGKDATLTLKNAYADYVQDPARLEPLIKSHIAALRQARSAPRRVAQLEAGASSKVDRTRIVPVIKDRQWVDDNVAGLKARGLQTGFVFDKLNKDLVVVYAEDDPARTRYLMAGEDLGIARKELRTLAVANLRRLLPKIEMSHEDHLTLVSAGGDYDASLLLLDEIWTSGQIKVEGDVVVAIPARNVLLVTGSQDRTGLRNLRTLVAKVAANGSHGLTRTLFVYRNGGFKKFGRN